MVSQFGDGCNDECADASIGVAGSAHATSTDEFRKIALEEAADPSHETELGKCTGLIGAESLYRILHKNVFKWGASDTDFDAEMPPLQKGTAYAEAEELAQQLSKQMLRKRLDGLSRRDSQMLTLMQEHVRVVLHTPPDELMCC